MADKPAKRLVKNPETFRERAIKAAEGEEKPKRGLRQAGGKVLSPVTRGGSKVANAKAFKPLRRPLRLIGKILVPTYFRNSWRELKQVNWPSWQQSRRLTVAVLIFAVIFGAAIAAVDYGLDKVFRQVLLK